MFVNICRLLSLLLLLPVLWGCFFANRVTIALVKGVEAMKQSVCIVTGANNGIGFETAKALAVQGKRVVMICRSRERGEAARQKIAAAAGRTPDLLLADLSLQAQVKQVAAQFRAKYDRLDVLVNVAGFSWNERAETSEGFERTFALNYLAYFTLSLELVDLLVGSAPARVVNVASNAHRWREIEFDNLQGEREFPVKRMPPLSIMYGWTNMMRIMFTYTLAERLGPHGVTANVLCPGLVPVKRSGVSPLMNRMVGLMRWMPRARTPEEAAQRIIWLASAPEAAELNGVYFQDGERMDSAPQTYDGAARDRLWEMTLALAEYDQDPSLQSFP
jgi:NAD(P)-dependent dehydrogenase (short-subunit alcohol dehydrogenase family)